MRRPTFTILIVGHFIVGGVLALEKGFAPPTWVHLAIWLPLTLVASLWLLPRVKGALVGLQWALYMHGFEPAQPPSRKPTTYEVLDRLRTSIQLQRLHSDLVRIRSSVPERRYCI